jgi:folate-binding protein YgfZ
VTSVAAQVQAAREGVLVIPAPELTTLLVTGGDRATWLNGLLTCDVLKAAEGEALYGLAVTQKGRVVTDVLVVKESERVVLVVPERIRDALVAQLDKYLIMEDAELAKGDLHVSFAHGPKAAELGVRYDPTGLGGALLFGEAPKNVTMGDEAGWEALRLERGVPRFGIDFDEKTYPQEAALEKRAVSFDKGCYLGQEVVCMLELRGHVKRKLVSFVTDERASVMRDATVTDRDGVEIGKVSSAADSPTLAKAVGLAMLKLAHTEPGTELRIGAVHARVVAAPAA